MVYFHSDGKRIFVRRAMVKWFTPFLCLYVSLCISFSTFVIRFSSRRGREFLLRVPSGLNFVLWKTSPMVGGMSLASFSHIH